ncbi:hypothetical protein K402DRAFT_425150 [Aulographum hederae CBS 113979]|uniref:Uncharacterized protein n=1 Tax=Aulographum hederae CBS 113979 TaxID=1176131 RepID=A0A6G1GLD1_9PEZI|nr:hypothetical protein K402DRAFT_425150 [Aulographum hederae CBS 113979]
MVHTPSGEKTMSSRLLTMKFMQRGTPNSSASSTPTSNTHSSKKRKLENGYSAVSPAVTAHQAAEEQKRNEFLERQAAEAGETRWMLSLPENKSKESPGGRNEGLTIVEAGFGDIDAADDDDSEEEVEEDNNGGLVAGRWRFGGFGRDTGNKEGPEDEDEDDEEESESDDEEDTTRASPGNHKSSAEQRQELVAKLREKQLAKAKVKKAEQDKLSHQRRQKEVRLNSSMRAPTSISSGGGSSGLGGFGNSHGNTSQRPKRRRSQD